MKTNYTAIDSADRAAASAGWSTYACSNAACSSATWLVQRVSGFDELWRVAEHPDASPALVAASDPVCPRCGSDLAAVLDLAREKRTDESVLMHWIWR
jgi:hypothetical protein